MQTVKRLNESTIFLKFFENKKRVDMDKLLENLKHATECGADKIYINRNTQLSLVFMRMELLNMDIEPNFSEKEYAGIQIELDNTLNDNEVRF